MNYKKIADFIIKEVQEKSTEFQLVVSVEDIGKGAGVKIDATNIVEIMMELGKREEIAGVNIERDKNDLICGFDVVLYTDHAPYYAGNLEFDLDVCRKCGKLITEGRILCKECV